MRRLIENFSKCNKFYLNQGFLINCFHITWEVQCLFLLLCALIDLRCHSRNLIINYWVIQRFIMDSIKHLWLNALEKKVNSYKSYQGNIHVYFLIRFLWNNFHYASERGVYSNMSHSRFCVTVVKFLFCSNIYVVFSWLFCWKSSCITDNSNDTV